jgi:hypothetical protein
MQHMTYTEWITRNKDIDYPVDCEWCCGTGRLSGNGEWPGPKCNACNGTGEASNAKLVYERELAQDKIRIEKLEVQNSTDLAAGSHRLTR